MNTLVFLSWLSLAQAEPTSPQTMNPDLSIVLDAAAAWFSDDEPLQAGAHDPARRGFTFQQLELAFGANVDPFFRLDADLVIAEHGVELEEAFATTLALPANLQARAGQFLTRFGRLNPTHPHAWSFVDQPLVNAKFFGGEGSRGMGAELSWLTPLPWFAELVASSTGAGEAPTFYGEADLGVRDLADLLYTLALKQYFALDDAWSILAGASAQLGPNASGNGNRSAIYGADLYVRYKPVHASAHSAVSLTVEVMARERQVPGDVLRDYGGYAQLIWRVNKTWEGGARYEQVSGVEADPLDVEWTDVRRRTTAQLTFLPSHFSRLRLQGSVDQPPSGWREDPIWAAMLQLEIVAGAHGAHEY